MDPQNRLPQRAPSVLIVAYLDEAATTISASPDDPKHHLGGSTVEDYLAGIFISSHPRRR
jgi:hypothetical protein